MTSYPAPTQNIDFFNPAFFTVDETPLTVADANKLYFKKSGGIISGAVSAPSLTLNGTNVENKLTEIDVNSTKLTDINYNSNTTSILNNLSVNGILTLPNLPNVGTDILSNKQKTTKITYDAGTSTTTIGDTLKASSTLIVGSQNYNASDEFSKLQNISRNASTLTINDSIYLSGTFSFPSFGDVENTLTLFEETINNISYDIPTNSTIITDTLKATGTLELGTITNVEQKIIDVSNGITPFISYDSVNDKLEVGKDMDLSINDLTCNFMRPLGVGKYGLSQNWTQSYLEFRNGGHHIDAFHGNGTGGRDLYLNFYAEKNIYLGSWFNNSTTFVNGNLNIIENTGTAPTSTGGSLTLTHNDAGGTSSIVFKSKRAGSDYGYISYIDDVNGGGGTRSVLELGVKTNPGGSGYVDNIALMPSGFVGINTRTPQAMLDVNGDMSCNGIFELGTITNVEQKIIDVSNAITPFISYDSVNDKLDVEKDMDLSVNDLTCNFMKKVDIGYGLSQNFNVSYLYFRYGGHHIDAKNPDGTGRDIFLNFYAQKNIYLGSWFNNSTTQVNGNLNITENTGTAPTATGGSLTLTHNDAGGTSSIVFKSEIDDNNDYGYISYQDNYGGSTQNSLLEIGVQNDGVGLNVDNIALMPSGFVGINTRTPQAMLDVNGNLNIDETFGTFHSALGGSLTLSHQNVGGMSSIVFKSRKDVNDYGYISYQDDYLGDDTKQRGLLAIGIQNDTDGIDTIDNIALMPSGNVGINTKIPSTTLDVNGNTRISGSLTVEGSSRLTGNVRIGSIVNVEEAINNAGIPSITYNEVTETTTFDGSFVIVPQLTITPEVPFNNATQEIYSKHSELNGVAELKLGNDIGGAIKFNNILKSENGNATFYGNDGGSETKYMEYNSIDDKINISKNMDIIGDISCNQMTMNNVFIGERTYNKNDGAGIMVRTLDNPSVNVSTAGSIFEVQSQVFSKRLWVGHGLTSSGSNKFMFGFDNTYGQEAVETRYKGKLDTDGSVDCTGLNIIENIGTTPSVTGGSLTLIHDNSGGTSSIVFKSKKDPTDRGYISYTDDISGDASRERSLLEIGCVNDGIGTNVDNIALMPSGYVGINTRTPQVMLDVNGDMNCQEIQVNSIPINSFTNYKFGSNYTYGNWGRGNNIRRDTAQVFLPSTSHGTLQFSFVDNQTFKCLKLGTYEITTNVIFRNLSSSRLNPCIGISVNDDTELPSPKWDLSPYNQTPFAVAYARLTSGKVTSLTAKRIHHFTNSLDEVHIKTYIEIDSGDTYDDTITNVAYIILDATVQFKYIGNFENIA